MNTANIKLTNIYFGYAIFFVLIGMQSIPYVFPNNNLNWVPENVVVGPGPVLLISPSKENVKECEEISADECLKKLQTFLRLTSLPYTSEKSELDKLCSNTIGGYNCSVQKVTLPNCLSPKDKSLFPTFLDMAQYTMFMFCSNGLDEHGYLRDVLLDNSYCILKQKKALDCCAEQSKVPDLPVMHILEENGRSLPERQIAACCPVSSYLKCVRTIVLEKCGEVAGNLTTEYIRRASGGELEKVCQKLPNYPELDQGICKTTVPVCSGSRISTFVELTTLMSIVFVIWSYYMQYLVI